MNYKIENVKMVVVVVVVVAVYCRMYNLTVSFIIIEWSQSSAVDRATRLRVGLSELRIPHCLWGSPNLLFNRYRCSLPRAKRPGRKVTLHFHLVPMLRMSGAIPLLPPICLYGVDRGSFTVYGY